MKVGIFLLLLLFVPFVITPVFAQTTDPYQIYVKSLNDYYTARTRFETARDQYRAYKTAQSKEDTLDSSKKMLEAGRVALLQYVALISNALRAQDDLNAGVKNKTLSDLDLHNVYLVSAEQTIKDSTTVEQLQTMGQALNLRYSYIRFTSLQALKYIDALNVKKEMNQARDITDNFGSIIAGYPDTNRSKNIVSKWLDDFSPQLTQDEVTLNNEVSSIYPEANQQDSRPLFEYSSGISSAQIDNLNLKQRQNAQTFKQMLDIAKKAYQEL